MCLFNRLRPGWCSPRFNPNLRSHFAGTARNPVSNSLVLLCFLLDIANLLCQLLEGVLKVGVLELKLCVVRLALAFVDPWSRRENGIMHTLLPLRVNLLLARHDDFR
jgi:hypothetical protein